jgi:hypothetical protein
MCQCGNPDDIFSKIRVDEWERAPWRQPACESAGLISVVACDRPEIS